MSRFVVDASVAVKWFLPEPHADKARELLAGGHDLLAPDLLLPEFGSVIWKRVRASEITPEEASEVLGGLLKLPVSYHPSAPLITPALDIAVRSQRTVYDSLYLALALREKATMVTADLRLFNALQSTPLASHVLWIENLGQRKK